MFGFIIRNLSRCTVIKRNISCKNMSTQPLLYLFTHLQRSINTTCDSLSFPSVSMNESNTSRCQDLFIECCFVPSVSCLYQNRTKQRPTNFFLSYEVMREVKLQ